MDDITAYYSNEFGDERKGYRFFESNIPGDDNYERSLRFALSIILGKLTDNFNIGPIGNLMDSEIVTYYVQPAPEFPSVNTYIPNDWAQNLANRIPEVTSYIQNSLYHVNKVRKIPAEKSEPDAPDTVAYLVVEYDKLQPVQNDP